MPVDLVDALKEMDAKIAADRETGSCDGDEIVKLADALPQIVAVLEAADAMRALDISPLYGAHAKWSKDGDGRAAKLLDDRDERIHVCIHRYDAARAAMQRAINEGREG